MSLAKLYRAAVTPAKRPHDARQQRTRAALLEALLALLETRPFDRVSIREIATVAGIGYATFFRHYPSKDALLEDVAAEEIAALLERALPLLYGDRMRESHLAVFAYVAEHRALWTALLTGGAAASLKAEFVAQARRTAQAHGEMPSWLPQDLSIVFAVGATVDIIAWWLREDPPVPVDEAASILERLVTKPVLAPA